MHALFTAVLLHKNLSKVNGSENGMIFFFLFLLFFFFLYFVYRPAICSLWRTL